MSVLVLASLLVFAFGAGRLVLRGLGGGSEPIGESRALAMAAGLGLIGVLLGILAVAGQLSWARWIIPAGAMLTAAAHAGRIRSWRPTRVPAPDASAVLVIAMIVTAALGALVPTTEFDSLAYPIPITQHLAVDNAWRFWPDQVRSVFPLSQELLMVPLLLADSRALGLVSAAALAIGAFLIVALARRVCRHRDAPWMAAIIALGCPAVAFLAASAKEDLLLIVMTTAAAVSLVSAPSAATAARVGLFAGFAMGTKLTGAPIALAMIACVPFCCGRTRPLGHLGLAALVAVLAGGVWPAVNFARFGNPLPLVSLGPWFSAPLLAPDVMTDWANGFGAGRGVLEAVLAPLRLATGSDLFGGRGNWINPLAFLGIAAALVRGLRRESWILVAIAAAAYLAWFAGIQVARLLLPALVLLSLPAADLLAWTRDRSRLARGATAVALVLSAGVVISVGVIRLERFAIDPVGFIARETPHYDGIAWLNTHLDPATDRVASSFEANGYLRIPWFTLNATYQIAIGPDELADPARLRAALERERVTHLFGSPDAFKDLAGSLELVYENPTSRVGGSSFFRAPRTEPAVIYRLRPR